MINAYVLAVMVVVGASCGQVMLKHGVDRALSGTVPYDGPLAKLAAVITSPYILGGLGLYAVSAVLWLLVLSRLDVTRAYPVLGLTFVVVPVVSALAIDETINGYHIVGGLLILAGVVVSTST